MRLRAALLLMAACALAAAQNVEPRTVRIVAPAPPGGNLDSGARMLALRLARLTGDVYVVENRPGANSLIAAELVAKSPPDGRTLLYSGTGLVFLPLQQKLSANPMDELVPVVQVSSEQYVLVMAQNAPVAAAFELAGFAAGKPGGVNCAAYPGVATLACEQLKARLGGKVTTIPYPGVAPAINAVLGGHADLMFVNREPTLKLVQAGKLRVLAQSSLAAEAGAPLAAQVWPGFVLEGHAGLLAPAGTPPALIEQLNRHVNRVLSEPEVIAHMREGAQEPAGGSPQRYADALQRTLKRYGELIRKLDLGPK